MARWGFVRAEGMPGQCRGPKNQGFNAASDMIPAAQQAWLSRSSRGHVDTKFKPSGQGLTPPPELYLYPHIKLGLMGHVEAMLRPR